MWRDNQVCRLLTDPILGTVVVNSEGCLVPLAPCLKGKDVLVKNRVKEGAKDALVQTSSGELLETESSKRSVENLVKVLSL